MKMMYKYQRISFFFQTHTSRLNLWPCHNNSYCLIGAIKITYSQVKTCACTRVYSHKLVQFVTMTRLLQHATQSSPGNIHLFMYDKSYQVSSIVSSQSLYAVAGSSSVLAASGSSSLYMFSA